MPGIDKRRARVFAVLVLLIAAAAALHGYLPGGGDPARGRPASGLGGTFTVTAILVGSTGLLVILICTGAASASSPVRALVAGGAGGVVTAEALSVVLAEREAVAWFSGVAVALALIAARWRLARGHRAGSFDAPTDDTATALDRWVERTESQIVWSDSTRADWDRRLRPMLARQFEFATRQPRARNPAAFDATGRILFGDELWAWVDPENVSRTGTQERGPGRAAFTDIIERLERL
ncbi:MAG: hypothetical protein ACREJT_06960 [Myxococcota bacterium]